MYANLLGSTAFILNQDIVEDVWVSHGSKMRNVVETPDSMPVIHLESAATTALG